MRSVDSITSKIVKKISKEEGVDPLELDPPLQSIVDLDAVEDLVSSGPDDQPKGGVCVSFGYQGYHVTIVSEDEVDVKLKDLSSS